MRIANLDNRLHLIIGDHAVDVAEASHGTFGPGIDAVYSRWEEFRAWAATFVAPDNAGTTYSTDQLGSPVLQPKQIIALGLNYRDHASEIGFDAPEGLPPVFTKFVTSVTGPDTTVTLPEGHVDWEVELAVVIGRTAHQVAPNQAWAHVAGVTVAQDLSERIQQMAGPSPQFSLGKSHPGFLPLGPVLVTIDELADPTTLALRTVLNGEIMQDGNTRDLIVPVADCIARLSEVITLLPGDVILTGTPGGVGVGRTPQRFLHDNDELVSSIEGIGTIRQRFTAAVR
ncbi:fumarylacetoacetate hydrolase family protein [Curtobacterium sp. MCBA15_013]|uniref:fumarylacetoacetate hydrolase family protein n=1 Tax=Curtobacterium sp. MCBA15_013 TaxID=1898739 RepID=UPI0008DDC2DB|nr:fumarylacetoacetate hydrolase family protein [Curtobacterium sp. MCBA15_013]OII18407.1 fumarylacetoacetate hydrolase [Curtobacterium sp. MCBA15_013]